MRVCTKCNQAKPDVDFRQKSGDKNVSWCTPCKRGHDKDRYQDPDRKAQIARGRKAAVARWQASMTAYLMEHPCVDCGEADIVVLEFDHLPGSAKTHNIAMMQRMSWKRTLEEIAKCEVVCANCHRRRTNKRADWYRTRPG